MLHRPARIALYSHDTMGLGHMRRNLLIARTLVSSCRRATVLLIAGAREVSAFAMPAGVDCVTLPAWRKEHNQYRPRSLDVTTDELLRLRSEILRTTLLTYEPDLLIVDNVPRGALGELTPALEVLRARLHTRIVLGLRDVLDDPETVEREWRRLKNIDVITKCFDAIWIYGDAAVFDARAAYQPFSRIASKITYVGYLNQRGHGVDDSPTSGGRSTGAGPFALCTLGGGQDGARLALTFARAEIPPGLRRVILTGPCMPPDDLARVR